MTCKNCLEKGQELSRLKKAIDVRAKKILRDYEAQGPLIDLVHDAFDKLEAEQKRWKDAKWPLNYTDRDILDCSFVEDHNCDMHGLFTITTISSRHMSTPVICSSFNNAKRFLREDGGHSLWEYHNMFAVIEVIRPDRIYGCVPDAQFWWLWHINQMRWRAIERPKCFDKSSWWCLSIG